MFKLNVYLNECKECLWSKCQMVDTRRLMQYIFKKSKLGLLKIIVIKNTIFKVDICFKHDLFG